MGQVSQGEFNPMTYKDLQIPNFKFRDLANYASLKFLFFYPNCLGLAPSGGAPFIRIRGSHPRVHFRISGELYPGSTPKTRKTEAQILTLFKSLQVTLRHSQGLDTPLEASENTQAMVFPTQADLKVNFCQLRDGTTAHRTVHPR